MAKQLHYLDALSIELTNSDANYNTLNLNEYQYSIMLNQRESKRLKTDYKYSFEQFIKDQIKNFQDKY